MHSENSFLTVNSGYQDHADVLSTLSDIDVENSSDFGLSTLNTEVVKREYNEDEAALSNSSEATHVYTNEESSSADKDAKNPHDKPRRRSNSVSQKRQLASKRRNGKGDNGEMITKNIRNLRKVNSKVNYFISDEAEWNDDEVIDGSSDKASGDTQEKPKNPSSGSESFSCRICPNIYASYYKRRVHEKTHRTEITYKCKYCKKSMHVKYKKSHDATHFHCNICNKTMGLRERKSHEGIHSNLASRSNIVKEKKDPPNDDQLSCKICQKNFPTSNKLKRHVRHHNDEKSHSCGVCSKRFRTPSHLTIHKRLHTGERPFKCNNCTSTFRQKGHLVRHIKTVHGTAE